MVGSGPRLGILLLLDILSLASAIRQPVDPASAARLLGVRIPDDLDKTSLRKAYRRKASAYSFQTFSSHTRGSSH